MDIREYHLTEYVCIGISLNTEVAQKTLRSRERDQEFWRKGVERGAGKLIELRFILVAECRGS